MKTRVKLSRVRPLLTERFFKSLQQAIRQSSRNSMPLSKSPDKRRV